MPLKKHISLVVAAIPTIAASSSGVAMTLAEQESSSAGEIGLMLATIYGLTVLCGLGSLGTATVKLLRARAERRAVPPTKHIGYQEVILQACVGLALIAIPAIGLTMPS